MIPQRAADARFCGIRVPNFGLVSAACALAALSGMAALAHQMIWTRRLVDLLGGSALTFSKVVGAFFLGLALGAAVAAVCSGPVKRPWRWVAAAELAIALLALPALLVPHVAERLYQSPQLNAWLNQLIPFVFVTPPAMAMGFVLPWLIRALNARSPERGLQPPSAPICQVAWLYAANTLGGVVGIAGVLLVVLPALGLTGAGLVVCGLNVLVAIIAFQLDRVPTEVDLTPPAHRTPEISAPQISPGPVMPHHLPLVLGFFSGFLVLSLEVVLQHQFAQVTINSFFSSATVLMLALLSLAAGSALAPWLARYVPDGTGRVQLILLTAALLCAFQPFVFTCLRDGVDILPYELPLTAYAGEVGKLALFVLCPLFGVAGLLFPLLLNEAASGSAPLAGRRVGALLAWNGLGGWLGSELAQSFLAPRFGLWQSVVIIGLGYALLAVALPWWRSPAPAQPSPWQIPRWLPLSAGTFLLITFVFAGELPQVTLHWGEHLAALQVGREGTVATVECGPGDWRIVFNNSYTLGGSKARANQEREAHLPILLHGHARTVGIIGVATGGTLAGAAAHPEIESIDAAELSPLVLKQAAEFFNSYSRDVFHDRRVHLFPDDARRMVALHRNAYDVVIGDLFLPWRTGEGRLFTTEHFQAVRRALKPDGVFCQWLPMFQLTRPQFEVIARSFQQVFPDAILVRGDFYTELPILGLVGGRSLQQINWQQVGQGCDALRASAGITDPLVRHEEGVAMMIIGALPARGDGPVNTLGNAWLEWNCGRNIIGMRTPWFIGVPEAEFVQGIERDAQAAMPPALRADHDSGQFFLTLEIAAKLKLPQLENFAAQVPDRLPVTLREDKAVSWQEWPMRIKPQLPMLVP